MRYLAFLIALAGCEWGFPDGQFCEHATSCDSGFCVGHVCCESACEAPNSDTAMACTFGTCAIAACSEGFGDCAGDPAVGCIDVTSDPDHCGGCDTSCTADPNIATRACTAGACSSTCEAGFANCTDTIGTTGCAETTTTVEQCGACGVTCVDADECTNDLCVDGAACASVARSTCGDAQCGSGCTIADADGDGIDDVSEARGFVDTNCNGVDDGPDIDLRLPGGNPARKTIFLAYDYMQKPGAGNTCTSDAQCSVAGEQCLGTCSMTGGDCASASDCPGSQTCAAPVCVHSHRPTSAALAAVVAAFAARNIDLVIDPSAERLVETAVITFEDGLPASCTGPSVSSFAALKASHFDPRRANLYHYAVFGHRVTCPDDLACSTCSLPETAHFGAYGAAERTGNDLIVSMALLYFDALAIPRTLENEAGAFMHLLGHNLGLQHGGGDAIDGKPNYFSVMNISFRFTGIESVAHGTRIDFSGATQAPLDESALVETVGITEGAFDLLHADDITHFIRNGLGLDVTAPATGAIDWDGDGTIEAGPLPPMDLTSIGTSEVLFGFDDWGHLDLRFQCSASPFASE
ncbi:MAG: hypothetical protein ABI867_36430 [Kofleriaceae bacterium]